MKIWLIKKHYNLNSNDDGSDIDTLWQSIYNIRVRAPDIKNLSSLISITKLALYQM